MDVFFFEAFEEEAHLLKQYCGQKFQAGYSYKTIQEYAHNEPPADIISIRTQSIIPNIWKNKIKAILTRSTGYDHIVKYKQDNNCTIDAGYLPEYCSRAVAEQAFMYILTLARKLFQQILQFNKFERDSLTGNELYHKKIAIIGVGNIGYELYKLAQSWQMEVFGVDIDKKHQDVNYTNLKDILKQTDIIVCTMNLTTENNNYFTYELLKDCKPGLIFINCSRGEFILPSVLLKLLNEKILGAAALDVYYNETELADSLRNNKNINDPELTILMKLSKLSNIILTPHNAFNTFESVVRKAEQSVRQIEYFQQKEEFIWKVPL